MDQDTLLFFGVAAISFVVTGARIWRAKRATYNTVKPFASLTRTSGATRIFAHGFAMIAQTPLHTRRRLPRRYAYMKPRTIFAHITIPAFFAAGVFIYALGRESFSFEMLISVLFGGFLFYAAPYLLWAFIVALLKPSNVVAHSGFISSTLALALIASYWFFPPDPSGLPMQWMLYWPLAIILLVLVVGGTAAYVRIKAPNKVPQPTPKSGAAEL